MPQACQSCLAELGGSTGKRLLLCGRCKRAAYCSTNCQKRDYARHKPQCIEAVEQQRLMGQLAEKLPGLARYEKDAQQLRTGVHAEAAAAARSMLRVGTPTSLHDSHFLVLTLEYHCTDGPLRTRYTFKDLAIEPYEGEASSATPAMLKRQEAFRSVRTTMREHDPVVGASGGAARFFRFVTDLRVEWVGPNGPFAKDFPVISIINKTQVEYFCELKDWPPNPDLHALSRRIFSAPNPLPCHSIFRDDYLSTFPTAEARAKVILYEMLDRDQLLKEGVKLLKR